MNEYRVGSIVRIKLINFLTYTDVEFHPGPFMNMVIGPNGTGKSTVVCAIAIGLAGAPAILGRHKDLKDFVKRGEERSSVEIELYNDDENTIIRRQFKRSDNISVWRLNGHSSNEKEVKEHVKSLNVQVDNLCQFLPQDKVASFAKMSYDVLLRETERAVGGDELVEMHKTLIHLKEQEVKMTRDTTGKRVEVERLEQQNQMIQSDVKRFQEREALQDNIKAVQLRLAQLSYDKDRDEYLQAKERKETLSKELDALIASEAPMRKQLADMEAKTDKKEAHAIRLKGKFMEETRSTRSQFKSQTESLESRSKEFSNKIKFYVNQQKADQANLAKYSREVETYETKSQAALDELIEAGAYGDDGRPLPKPIGRHVQILEEIDNLNNDMRSIHSGRAALDEEKSSLKTDIDDVKKRGSKVQSDLQKLDDVRVKKLSRLAHLSPDCREMVEWLMAHRGDFTQHVFEPVCLEINLRDPRYANAIEACINTSLYTFIVQNAQDYETLCSAADHKHLRINVSQITVRLEEFQPFISRNELVRFGFDGYLLDFLEGPSEVLAHLCKKHYIHTNPVSLEEIPYDQPDDRIRTYFNGQNKCVIQAAYGSKSTQITSLFPSKFLNLSLDMEEKELMEKELQECSIRLRTLETSMREVDKKLGAIERKTSVLDEKKKEWLDEKKRLSKLRQDFNSYVQRLNTARNKLETIEEKTAEYEQKITVCREKLQTTAVEQARLYIELAEFQNNAATQLREVTRAICAFIQLKNETDTFATTIGQNDLLAREARLDLENVSNALKTLRGVARATLERLRVVQAESSEEVIVAATRLTDSSVDDLKASLARDKARVDMILTINPRILEEYNERNAKIASMKGDLAHIETRLATHQSEMNQIKTVWKGELEKMIACLAPAFSKSFEAIGCAGDIVLHEEEDYAKWAIEILVKFRDNEKMQPLSATRQSGGERAVSTILYLMALQDISMSPFRVVDEINQGMDPRNERLIHKLIVDSACGDNACQYFLITPKLLPNLEYHERMKILVVMNGVYQDKFSSLGSYIKRRV